MERRLKLVALKPLRYAGKSLLSGDEFEASAKDARLLKAIRKAADAPVQVVPNDNGARSETGKTALRKSRRKSGE